MSHWKPCKLLTGLQLCFRETGSRSGVCLCFLEECSIPVEVGPCRGEFPRFYYNTTSHSCEGFAFGGCRGNVNNFLSREECESTCGVGTAPSEEMATTEPAPSLVDTTVLPSKAPPEEEPTHAYALPPVPATTLLPPPVPEPSEGDASDPTTSPQSTTWWPDWLPDWISTDTFWSVWEWAKEIHEQYWIYIYAGAAGVALLLIVLIVVLVIVCRRRRRRRREALRVRTHPGKRWRDSEMGGFYDRLRRGTRFGRQEPVYANVRTGPKSKHKPKTKRRR
ncbi:CD226 antigen isoform X5 [Engraulis encrasicolus]|uniref:CD226 antigen isoform X5 n=1 Tax=Engraulis encrasicolus TaxID=184585 RepID=UPI002FCEB958